MIICIVKGTLFQEKDQLKKKNYIFLCNPVNVFKNVLKNQ